MRSAAQAEGTYGGLLSAVTYEENVPEGEDVRGQGNKSATLVTGTPVHQVHSTAFPHCVSKDPLLLWPTYCVVSMCDRAILAVGPCGVLQTLPDGTPNDYYLAFSKMKQYCDEDYDLVFTTTFGHMSQTIDVSSGYGPCAVAANGGAARSVPSPHPASHASVHAPVSAYASGGCPPLPLTGNHETHFVHASGYRTNQLTNTVFGKIYQMRYLTGLVAGDILAAPIGSPYATKRGNTCVGYLAALPLPEVQRGINAFAKGCKERFAGCVVKVRSHAAPSFSTSTDPRPEEPTFLHISSHRWCGPVRGVTRPLRVLLHTTSGTLHSALHKNQPLRPPSTCTCCDLHANSRSTIDEVPNGNPRSHRCDIITQHSDTLAPQFVYKNYGGVGIGYNSNMRELVGDSVLTAPMLNWGPLWEIFIAQLLRGEWQENTQPWPGAHEGAVKLMPTFSPKVPPETVQFVQREQEKLIAAAGTDEFKHIFCGPLLKRWAYEFADPAAGSGPRAQGCGTRPVWRRLDPPEQVNLNHYRDKDGNSLNADRTVPLDTDCL